MQETLLSYLLCSNLWVCCSTRLGQQLVDVSFLTMACGDDLGLLKQFIYIKENFIVLLLIKFIS
jgi:hypothetical protein